MPVPVRCVLQLPTLLLCYGEALGRSLVAKGEEQGCCVVLELELAHEQQVRCLARVLGLGLELERCVLQLPPLLLCCGEALERSLVEEQGCYAVVVAAGQHLGAGEGEVLEPQGPVGSRNEEEQ